MIHNHKALRITSDSVLIASWACTNERPNNILDIGTGNGVISLMLAQCFKHSSIYGIEIDKDAAELAERNFRNSKWNNRLHVINEDLKNYHPKELFNLIISNPPFFENSLLSKNETLIRSKHSIYLTIEDILNFSNQYLTKKGKLKIIIPYENLNSLKELIESYNLSLTDIIYIYPKYNSKIRRVITTLELGETHFMKESSLMMEKYQRHDYHVLYKNLCKDYYLNF